MSSHPNDCAMHGGPSQPSRSVAPETRGAGAVANVSRSLSDCPDLLTVQDLHGLTGLSEQTIRAEINSGNLPGFRIGRRMVRAENAFSGIHGEGARQCNFVMTKRLCCPMR